MSSVCWEPSSSRATDLQLDLRNLRQSSRCSEASIASFLNSGVSLSASVVLSSNLNFIDAGNLVEVVPKPSIRRCVWSMASCNLKCFVDTELPIREIAFGSDARYEESTDLARSFGENPGPIDEVLV